MDIVVQAVVDFVKDNQFWALPIVFFIAFGESFCFFSLILPGTAMLVGISALLAASGVDASVVVPAILSATVGGSLGYAVSYWIGLYFKDHTNQIWPFSQYPHWIDEGEEFFNRYGAFGVFLGHFFGPIRAVIPVVAGMFQMPALPFQVANISSALIWAAGVIAPAFYVVNFSDEIFAMVAGYRNLAIGLLCIFALITCVPRMMVFGAGTALFVTLSAVFVSAGGNIFWAFGAGLLGMFVGDMWCYWCGSKAQNTRVGGTMTLPADDRAAIVDFLERWGVFVGLVLSKFFGAARSGVPVELGANQERLPVVLPASIVGSVAWTTACLVPAVVVGVFAN